MHARSPNYAKKVCKKVEKILGSLPLPRLQHNLSKSSGLLHFAFNKRIFMKGFLNLLVPVNLKSFDGNKKMSGSSNQHTKIPVYTSLQQLETTSREVKSCVYVGGLS